MAKVFDFYFFLSRSDLMDGKSSPFELYKATKMLNQLLACELGSPRPTRRQESSGGVLPAVRRGQSPRSQWREQQQAPPQSPLELFTPRPVAKASGEHGGVEAAACSELSASEMVRQEGGGADAGDAQISNPRAFAAAAAAQRSVPSACIVPFGDGSGAGGFQQGKTSMLMRDERAKIESTRVSSGSI